MIETVAWQGGMGHGNGPPQVALLGGGGKLAPTLKNL